MIPVFTYHAISSRRTSYTYDVAAGLFQQHLDVLTSRGYEALTAESHARLLAAGRGSQRPHQAHLTFDDGHESDFLAALPMLRSAGLKATFFVTAGWTGKPGYLTVAMLRDMLMEGMSIQSHGLTHALLDGLDDESLLRELEDSRRRLEDFLGNGVFALSLPGGRQSERVFKQAAASGYTAVYTSEPYHVRKIGESVVIGRYGVKQSTSQAEFAQAVAMGLLFIKRKRAAYRFRLLLRRSIGEALYQRLWAGLTGKRAI